MINVFGERLKKLRKEKSHTQEDVASLLNINRTTLIKWEKGTAEPSISHLRLLSKEFNVDISYLLGEDDFTLFLIYTADDFCKAKKQSKERKGEQIEFADWIVFWNKLIKRTLNDDSRKWHDAYRSIGMWNRKEQWTPEYPKDYNNAILEYIINAEYNKKNNSSILPDDAILWIKTTERPPLYYYMYGYYPSK